MPRKKENLSVVPFKAPPFCTAADVKRFKHLIDFLKENSNILEEIQAASRNRTCTKAESDKFILKTIFDLYNEDDKWRYCVPSTYLSFNSPKEEVEMHILSKKGELNLESYRNFRKKYKAIIPHECHVDLQVNNPMFDWAFFGVTKAYDKHSRRLSKGRGDLPDELFKPIVTNTVDEYVAMRNNVEKYAKEIETKNRGKYILPPEVTYAFLMHKSNFFDIFLEILAPHLDNHKESRYKKYAENFFYVNPPDDLPNRQEFLRVRSNVKLNDGWIMVNNEEELDQERFFHFIAKSNVKKIYDTQNKSNENSDQLRRRFYREAYNHWLNGTLSGSFADIRMRQILTFDIFYKRSNAKSIFQSKHVEAKFTKNERNTEFFFRNFYNKHIVVAKNLLKALKFDDGTTIEDYEIPGKEHKVIIEFNRPEVREKPCPLSKKRNGCNAVNASSLSSEPQPGPSHVVNLGDHQNSSGSLTKDQYEKPCPFSKKRSAFSRSSEPQTGPSTIVDPGDNLYESGPHHYTKPSPLSKKRCQTPNRKVRIRIIEPESSSSSEEDHLNLAEPHPMSQCVRIDLTSQMENWKSPPKSTAKPKTTPGQLVITGGEPFVQDTRNKFPCDPTTIETVEAWKAKQKGIEISNSQVSGSQKAFDLVSQNSQDSSIDEVFFDDYPMNEIDSQKRIERIVSQTGVSQEIEVDSEPLNEPIPMEVSSVEKSRLPKPRKPLNIALEQENTARNTPPMVLIHTQGQAMIPASQASNASQPDSYQNRRDPVFAVEGSNELVVSRFDCVKMIAQGILNTSSPGNVVCEEERVGRFFSQNDFPMISNEIKIEVEPNDNLGDKEVSSVPNPPHNTSNVSSEVHPENVSNAENLSIFRSKNASNVKNSSISLSKNTQNTTNVENSPPPLAPTTETTKPTPVNQSIQSTPDDLSPPLASKQTDPEQDPTSTKIKEEPLSPAIRYGPYSESIQILTQNDTIIDICEDDDSNFIDDILNPKKVDETEEMEVEDDQSERTTRAGPSHVSQHQEDRDPQSTQEQIDKFNFNDPPMSNRPSISNEKSRTVVDEPENPIIALEPDLTEAPAYDESNVTQNLQNLFNESQENQVNSSTTPPPVTPIAEKTNPVPIESAKRSTEDIFGSPSTPISSNLETILQFLEKDETPKQVSPEKMMNLKVVLEPIAGPSSSSNVVKKKGAGTKKSEKYPFHRELPYHLRRNWKGEKITHLSQNTIDEDFDDDSDFDTTTKGLLCSQRANNDKTLKNSFIDRMQEEEEVTVAALPSPPKRPRLDIPLPPPPSPIIPTKNSEKIRTNVPLINLQEFHYTPADSKKPENFRMIIHIPTGKGTKFLEIREIASIKLLLQLPENTWNAFLGLLRNLGSYSYIKRNKNSTIQLTQSILKTQIDLIIRQFEHYPINVTFEHEKCEHGRQVVATCIPRVFETPPLENVFDPTFIEEVKKFKSGKNI